MRAYEQMNAETGTLIGVVIFTTPLVGGVAAYGSTLLALPLVVWLAGDMRATVLALLIVATLQSVYILARVFRAVHWPELAHMSVVAGIGLPIGILTANQLPERPMVIMLGVLGRKEPKGSRKSRKGQRKSRKGQVLTFDSAEKPSGLYPTKEHTSRFAQRTGSRSGGRWS